MEGGEYVYEWLRDVNSGGKSLVYGNMVMSVRGGKRVVGSMEVVLREGE